MNVVKNITHLGNYKVVQDNNEILHSLMNGETVAHWEFGDSMTPMIRNKEYCIIQPVENKTLKEGDAVFCRVNGNLMVHMIWKISDSSYDSKPYYQIGTTNGIIFGWTREIFGLANGTDVFEDAIENIN